MNIKFDEKGLIPVITQDYLSKEVLMLAYMNEESYNLTIQTGKVHYYSRSRKELWLKGATSGHYQNVKKIMLDCDNDTILIFVKQDGVPCHTGKETCFHNEIETSFSEKIQNSTLKYLSDIIKDRKENPVKESYTNYLFDKGLDKILKKVGEEASEVIIGSKNEDKNEITYEVSDLIYHLTVLLSYFNMTWDDIFEELNKRH